MGWEGSPETPATAPTPTAATDGGGGTTAAARFWADGHAPRDGHGCGDAPWNEHGHGNGDAGKKNCLKSDQPGPF